MTISGIHKDDLQILANLSNSFLIYFKSCCNSSDRVSSHFLSLTPYCLLKLLSMHLLMPLKSLKSVVNIRRVNMSVEVGSVEGKSYNRPTGVSLPFNGQPVQGNSGIKYMDDGTYWILTDNGYGSKANSPDAMLFIRQYHIDWNTGVFEPIKTIFFNDADHVMTHRIVHEGTERSLFNWC